LKVFITGLSYFRYLTWQYLSLANNSQPGLLLSWHAARAVVVVYYFKTGLMEVGSAGFEFHVMAVALTLPPFSTSSWIR
jgi:hypothetical protein